MDEVDETTVENEASRSAFVQGTERAESHLRSKKEVMAVTLRRYGEGSEGRTSVDWHIPCQRPLDRCECES